MRRNFDYVSMGEFLPGESVPLIFDDSETKNFVNELRCSNCDVVFYSPSLEMFACPTCVFCGGQQLVTSLVGCILLLGECGE